MGAGRTELMECVAGRLRASGGRVLLHGKDVSRLSIAERIAAGLVLVPEDRQRDGLVQTMSVGQNLSLASIGDFTRALFTSRKREQDLIDRSIRDVHIKTAGGAAMIGSLSGGNQQKVVIGKMLATNPSVVMLDEPSRGIDIGAKSEVFKLLAEGAKSGLAVLYSTSEVGECLSVAHRIIVMSKGKIAAEFGPDVNKEKIMAASGEVDLRQELIDEYGLKHCEVVSDIHQDELPLEALGLAGSKFLQNEIDRKEEMVIGVGYGRTLEASIENLPHTTSSHVRFISLMGGLTRKFAANPHEVINRLAERTGAQAFVMPVPFIANTEKDREMLLGQRGIAEAFALASECDLMVVGIGNVGHDASLVATGMIDHAEIDAIMRLGGAGEVLGHFFDDNGRPVETELSQRILSLPLDQMKNKRVVAFAGGAVKVRAIRAVLRSGLLTGLITDERTARAIVDMGETQAAAGSAAKRA